MSENVRPSTPGLLSWMPRQHAGSLILIADDLIINVSCKVLIIPYLNRFKGI
jgi:hypothetical protein